jgi:hypothetical protein
MSTYHVLAGIGDFAEDHRSLGVFEADSAQDALERCLAEHERESELVGVPPEFARLVREEHRLLCLQLRQPDAYFIVTPVAVEAHLVRDHTGVVREATEVARRRAVIRREFGLDVV